MSSSEMVGLDRLVGRLRSLPKQVAGPIAVKAVRAGLQVEQKAIRALANPFLRVTVGYRLARRTDPLLVKGIVGINVGRQANESERWAPIQVVGSAPRQRKTRSGKLVSTGQIIGNHIVKQGVESSRGEVNAVMRSVLKNEFAKLNK